MIVPNRTVLDPLGVAKPPSTWLSPRPMKAVIARRSLWLKDTGATWVGAKIVVSVAAAAVPATTIPTAPMTSPARSDTAREPRRPPKQQAPACRRRSAPSSRLRCSSRSSRAHATSASGTSCGADNSRAARLGVVGDLRSPSAAAPTAGHVVGDPVRNGQGLVIEPPKHPVSNVSHGPSPFEAQTPPS